MIKTLDDFRREMEIISEQGWIRTHRSGPTGIGKTLEDLLGIEENNASEPDFGAYELKAARDTDSSMLTLFTKSPQPPRVNSYLLNEYGYQSDNYEYDKKVLHSTLSANSPSRIASTGKTLVVACTEDRIVLVGNDGYQNTDEAYWEREKLRQAFNRKYKHTLVYVKAKSRGVGSDEEFLFYEAYELSGFDYDGLMDLLRDGVVKIDIRIGQYSDGRAHDHGTGFRIHPQYFYKLFRNKTLIWSRQ